MTAGDIFLFVLVLIIGSLILGFIDAWREQRKLKKDIERSQRHE